MRASELIAYLSELIEKHGDQVVVSDRDTDVCEPEFVEGVFVIEFE